MATAEVQSRELKEGAKLTRDEFMRLWEMNPRVKFAELIGGVVDMPSPLSVDHGDMDGSVGYWLSHYKAATPGCACGHNTTTYLLEDVPQPDINLRILPEYRGKSWIDGKYLAGAPELLAEICLSSASYDLHQKFDLYEAAGVQEYLAVLLNEKEIRWHVLENGKYQRLQPDADGIWQSRVFPGLWLDGAALLVNDTRRVFDCLLEGISSPAHQAFARQLAEKKTPQA